MQRNRNNTCNTRGTQHANLTNPKTHDATTQEQHNPCNKTHNTQAMQQTKTDIMQTKTTTKTTTHTIRANIRNHYTKNDTCKNSNTCNNTNINDVKQHKTWKQNNTCKQANTNHATKQKNTTSNMLNQHKSTSCSLQGTRNTTTKHAMTH